MLCIKLHKSTSKYYKYSQNKHYTQKRKTARSFVTNYITYVHGTCKHSTTRCYDKLEFRNDDKSHA